MRHSAIHLCFWLTLVGTILTSTAHAQYTDTTKSHYVPDASVLLLKACGLKSRHNWRDLAYLEAGSALLAFTISTGLKHSLDVPRPYGNVYNSFPSGHTVTAFVGAEMLRREYGSEYPIVAIAGYTVATSVGLLRMYNNRHWASDVLAGAGVGILSVSLMYWLAPYLTF